MTTQDMITLNPDDLDLTERYKLLIGTVVPRPIAFVSTVSENGDYNVAPFSYFNVVCTNPPTVLFCPNINGRTGEKKDTLKNIEATKEYVINIVTEDIVEQVNQSAAEYEFGVSEFDKTGLTPIASDVVKAPRVKESPIQLECQLQQIVQVGDGNRGTGFVVLGTIVRFHYRNDVYDNGKILPDVLKPVGRMAGTNYVKMGEMFSIPRPEA